MNARITQGPATQPRRRRRWGALTIGVALTACSPQLQWQTDFEAGLQIAQARSRPAFVYFDAAWCSWCQDYKQRTLSDARLRAALARSFVPVLVDFDARPDLVARYRVRGLPYTLVLDADGRVRNGFVGILTPDDLLEVLSVSLAATPLPIAAPEITLRATDVDRAAFAAFQRGFLQHIEQLYSAEYGTLVGRFDTGATLKRPSPLTWMYLMEHGIWPERIAMALAAEQERLADPVDGGFFNFLDPSRMTSEYLETSKLLESNAWLTAWFARASGKDPRYRAVAQRGYDYLVRVLWDTQHHGFFQAQIADQAYYALAPAARRAAPAPSIDRIKRADTNTQAAWALLEYGHALDDPAAVEYAARTIDFVLRELLHDGQLRHAVRDGSLGPAAPLTDALWLLAAGAQLHSVRPDGARRAALDALAHQTAAQVEAQRQRRDGRPAGIEDMALLSWVALQPLYAQAFAPGILPWALLQLRLEADTPPDDLIAGLRAWEQALHSGRLAAAPRQ